MPWPDTSDLLDGTEIRSALRVGKQHYVYVLYRDDSSPFYVGKGVNDRCLHHEAEARTTRRLTHKLNVIRSLHRSATPILYQIDSFHDRETNAHCRERELIALIGRHDLKTGPLTNQTDGGEGASNPSNASKQRRREALWGENAEDPERRIANEYFQKLTAAQSVTLKPAATWKRAEPLWRNRPSFPKTPRQAATIAASAIANRIMLKAGALIPRRFHIDDVELIIENGVGRDMLSSDMVVLNDSAPAHEVFELTKHGFEYLVDSLGRGMLLDAGVLSPDIAD